MSSKRILVPVDGSECSIHALEYAAKRRWADDVQILVLNVQPPMRPSRTITRELITEYQTRNTQAALKPAMAAMKRLQIEGQCRTLIGDPAPTIVQFAKKQRCGEIVMGNSGLGVVAGLALGSIARKVILLAQTPVVLVK